MNMIMVLWCRFQRCLGSFSIFLSRHPLKWDFLDIYLTRFLESVTSKIQNLWGSFLNLKYLKDNLDFENAAKNREKAFPFLDNCIGIGILNLSLWTTSYSSSTAYVLTSSPKILDVNKRDFFPPKFLGSDQWIL